MRKPYAHTHTQAQNLSVARSHTYIFSCVSGLHKFSGCLSLYLSHNNQVFPLYGRDENSAGMSTRPIRPQRHKRNLSEELLSKPGLNEASHNETATLPQPEESSPQFTVTMRSHTNRLPESERISYPFGSPTSPEQRYSFKRECDLHLSNLKEGVYQRKSSPVPISAADRSSRRRLLGHFPARSTPSLNVEVHPPTTVSGFSAINTICSASAFCY